MMVYEKIAFLSLIFTMHPHPVEAGCIVMPTEIKYSHGGFCKKENEMPNEVRCPYEYPYIEQNVQNTIPILGRSYTFHSCQSTKVCCEYMYEDSIPDNPIKLKEMYLDIKNCTLPEQKEKYEKIKNILEPPVVPVESIHKEPIYVSYIFTVLVYILFLSFVFIILFWTCY